MNAYGGGGGGGYSRTTTTTYGATGGDDGGGFMFGSQAGSQSGARPINEESLRPVTIKQLIDAEQAFSDAPFRIDGVEVKTVTIVGMVRAVNAQTTNITYRLDDGTGTIEVKKFIDIDKQQDDDNMGGAGEHQIRLEEYVRVWGKLKSFSNKRHLGAHVIKPVRDFNEVNYHFLESTYVHLFFTRGGLPSAGGAGGGAGDDDSMFVDGGAGGGGAGLADMHQDKMSKMSPRAKKVFNYLNNAAAGNEGTNMHVVAKDIGMPVQEVMAAAHELLNNGAIYETVDDMTFAILEY